MALLALKAQLPEIKIVRHASARSLRLRVEPTGIRLTVPLFCTKKQIQQFLNQSEQWLIETWDKQQKQLNLTAVFPEQIKLFYHVQPFQIIHQQQRNIFKFDWAQHALFIRNEQPEKALQAATLGYAKQFLPEYLTQISQEISLPYQSCTIRKPKTRWGSCSSRQDIMLHAALVLMPEENVRAVCVHELVHTQHFDHSPAFWHRVSEHDPEYLHHRRQLKSIQLPAWWYV
ncbi:MULTISPECIES: SprT family zinc-dependent metalloprotease [unclassified Acinetobacter]|uniref:YgjP family zinc-dependent metalloprotease n=1 Tax=unclassified Acinetobacter TaxID=196816 RepID=UPI00244CF3DA|nr:MULTISPECIES: SprT family zinc-dependent metalloprotease [unclassified Acinetobacter]MDH0030370.1 M48 family metallopeptidase [Acinetobacter sp. GD04021]MDH0885938.1 M48 family metallopeptidase [Acinetobacter sp. GD03873]MDH1082558.1 M48 family metallopeptidase [Acinetobacter sp. GD03983]MDH2189050.1 M48 family metallopeptidase [Acinetobacter sp. GD03645]MDH2202238.1 M48 family metallopeptidase [Acinetobacter sp. GD03647]